MSIQMTIELSTEKPRKDGYYTAHLDLPATDMEIEDAVRRARFHNESARRYLAIEESELFDASYLAVGADNLHELNYLARRLDGLSDEDAVKYAAVYAARTEEFPRDAYMQVRSAINMTYGLDAVPVASNVSNNYELGKFIVENDFDERFENIPDSVLEYLDYEQSENHSVSRTAASLSAGAMFRQGTMKHRTCMTANIFRRLHPNKAPCSAC